MSLRSVNGVRLHFDATGINRLRAVYFLLTCVEWYAIHNARKRKQGETDMETITLCKYETNGIEAAAVYKPKTHAQARFAPRFSDDRECKMFKQTPIERLAECILTHYPAADIKVINKKPWE